MTASVDFAMLPPEVNSARMYSGAGSGQMLAGHRRGMGWPLKCAPSRCLMAARSPQVWVALR
jgi:hypothetical protein